MFPVLFVLCTCSLGPGSPPLLVVTHVSYVHVAGVLSAHSVGARWSRGQQSEGQLWLWSRDRRMLARILLFPHPQSLAPSWVWVPLILPGSTQSCQQGARPQGPGRLPGLPSFFRFGSLSYIVLGWFGGAVCPSLPFPPLSFLPPQRPLPLPHLTFLSPAGLCRHPSLPLPASSGLFVPLRAGLSSSSVFDFSGSVFLSRP